MSKHNEITILEALIMILFPIIIPIAMLIVFMAAMVDVINILRGAYNEIEKE